MLVCPDVGCGVFANDPQVLGTMLGQVLREPKMSKLEVLLTGQVAFADAVQKAVSGTQATEVAAMLSQPGGAHSGSSSILLPGVWEVWHQRLRADEFIVEVLSFKRRSKLEGSCARAQHFELVFFAF